MLVLIYESLFYQWNSAKVLGSRNLVIVHCNNVTTQHLISQFHHCIELIVLCSALAHAMPLLTSGIVNLHCRSLQLRSAVRRAHSLQNFLPLKAQNETTSKASGERPTDSTFSAEHRGSCLNIKVIRYLSGWVICMDGHKLPEGVKKGRYWYVEMWAHLIDFLVDQSDNKGRQL